MKLVLKRNGELFDVPRDIGRALLGITDQLVEYTEPPAAPRVAASAWHVTRGTYNPEPILVVRCSSCNQSANFMGPTAHRTQHFSHCGLNEKPPKHVASEFERAARAYFKKAPRLHESRPAFLTVNEIS